MTLDIPEHLDYERAIRVGFVGCGSHAFRNIYSALQFLPVQLAAVCDLDMARATAFARQFGAEAAYNSVSAMLAHEGLDAVIVVTSYDEQGRPRYPEIAEQALAAGLHVWMEKPPAATTAETQAMQWVADAAGKNVVVGFKAESMTQRAGVAGGAAVGESHRAVNLEQRRAIDRLGQACRNIRRAAVQVMVVGLIAPVEVMRHPGSRRGAISGGDVDHIARACVQLPAGAAGWGLQVHAVGRLGAAAVTDVSPPTFTATTPPTITVQPSVTASLTPTATFTAIPYPYVVQEGCPVYMPNFAHPDAGCNWLGVAGQVFDAEHIGIENLVVIAGGTLAGNPIDIVQMTGSATAYGSGGYELVLSSTVVASEGTLWVQVKDLAGTPLTPKIYLDTHDDCFQNLLLLNFVQQ